MRTTGDDGAPAAAGGIGALIRRHPTAWLVGAIAVGFLVLGTSALFAGVAIGSSNAAEPVSQTPEPDPRGVPSPAPTSVPIRSCSIAGPAADPRLMTFYGTVINANDGTVLFDRQGKAPASTGSVMKVLTAAAALEVLGPDYRFTTTVQAGSSPNTIVLIGGGDPTLARYGDNVYPGSASLLDLASQVNTAWASAHPGQDIDHIVLDSSMWDRNDKWDPSWDRIEQQLGYSSEVTALMVDGDRDDPYSATSPRSTDPITRAGEAFADALGVPGADLTFGTNIGGQQLGQVQSPTIAELIPYMLMVSDNTLADQLSRVVSVESGFGGSSASINNAFHGALKPYGIPTDGMTFRDGSGLSDLNAVTTTYIAQFMQKVRAGEGQLGIVLSGLPTAGQSGTLAWRFTGANAVATGAVIAKTGMLEREWAMGGIINSRDGTPLTFAVYAIGDGIPDDAPDALDTVVTAAYICGNNLSNY
jgi:D-alanyl-D-alanine carboxypeptidase/D-alanyl-D-alanine-endopeptidase (penicillin-binding protein 4)